MTTATVVGIEVTFFKQALNAIERGERSLPCFYKANVGCITQLLAWDCAFAISDPASEQFKKATLALHDALVGTNEEGSVSVKWPSDKNKGERYLRSIIMAARSLSASEGMAIGELIKASLFDHKSKAKEAEAGSSAASGSSDKDLTNAGGALFNGAAKIFSYIRSVEMDKRVSYKLVKQYNEAFTQRAPLATPLGDFTLQLNVLSSKAEQYSHFGKIWESTEADVKIKTIKEESVLWDLMERRKQCHVSAGAFDAVAAASARNETLEPEFMRPQSKVEYIDGVTIKSINAFCTPEGQDVEIEKMKEFRKKFPHIQIEKIVKYIDAPNQRDIANLLNKGYTRDAAVWQIARKSPENWAASLCEGAATETAEVAAASASAAKDGGGKGKKTDRSTEDQATVFEKRLKQKDEQIANLKKGKPYGKGGGGWQSAGKGGGGGGWQNGGGNGWNGGGGYNNGGWQGGGKGGGPPAGPQRPPFLDVRCPPDVCRDFNFKGAGCTNANCHYKHVCAKCKGAHACRACTA